MKFCTACGTMLDEHCAVCPKCGTPAAAPQPDPSADIFIREQGSAPVSNDAPTNESVYQPVSEAPVDPVHSYNEMPVSPAPNYYNMPAEPASPAPKKKIKWWMIALPVVLVIAIVIALLWNPLMLRLNPKGVLAKALVQATAQLSERSSGSPLVLMGSALADTENYTVLGNLNGSDGFSDIDVDMAIYWNSVQARHQTDFRMEYQDEYLDLSIYADADSLAVASERLLSGEYYGITYDTFSEDIRGSELFSAVDEQTLSALEQLVQVFHDTYETAADQKPISGEYAVVITDFANGLDAVVGSAERKLNAKEQKLDTITMTVTYKQISSLMEQLLEIAEDDEALQNMLTGGINMEGVDVWDEYVSEYEYMIDAFYDTEGEIVVTFYLYKNDLVAIGMDTVCEYEGAEGEIHIDLNLGRDPAADDIVLSMIIVDEGEEAEILCTLTTEKDGSSFTETVLIDASIPGEEGVAAELSYGWDMDSGDLTIAVVGVEDMEFSMDLTLEQTENGFALSVDDLYGALSATGMEDAQDYADLKLGFYIEVMKGAEITVPEYKNIDQWTQDDLLALAMELQNFG